MYLKFVLFKIIYYICFINSVNYYSLLIYTIMSDYATYVRCPRCKQPESMEYWVSSTSESSKECYCCGYTDSIRFKTDKTFSYEKEHTKITNPFGVAYVQYQNGRSEYIVLKTQRAYNKLMKKVNLNPEVKSAKFSGLKVEKRPFLFFPKLSFLQRTVRMIVKIDMK